MRNQFSLFIVLLLALYSCTNDPQDFIDDNVLSNPTRSTSVDDHVVAIVRDIAAPAPTPLQEIIIKYHSWVTEETKEEMRATYGVVDYKTCDCSGGVKVYELWKMDTEVQIEPTIKKVKKERKDEVEFIAPNQSFTMPVSNVMTHEDDSMEEYYTNHNDDFSHYLTKIVPSNTGVSIAVLDTGIDPSFAAFSTPFLYNSSTTGQCNEFTGYDFVNSDIHPFDDDPFKHGTVVSHVIYKELTSRGISFQILPVKVADSKGKSTLFSTFCGLLYAIQNNVDVINMSLGWIGHDQDVYDLFSQLIDGTSAAIVTSAGNNDSNNDVVPHYPSNFPHSNVIAVAASNESRTRAALYSNYGANTVDFFAVGNKIYFPLLPTQNRIHHDGTSFAAPLVSARVAELTLADYADMVAALSQQFSIPIHFSKLVIDRSLIP